MATRVKVAMSLTESLLGDAPSANLHPGRRAFSNYARLAGEQNNVLLARPSTCQEPTEVYPGRDR